MTHQEIAFGSAAEGRQIILTPASAINIRPVKYLWDLRIALGAFWLLAGREGIGKSVLWAWLSAALTRGRLPGVFLGTPRSVIVAASEDSWAHTLVPRLMAAGADLARVYRVDVVGGDEALSLPRDLARLESLIVEANAGLIILDPLMSRLDNGLDSHKDQETRKALEPLAHIAERTNTAVLGLIHLNKGNSSDALNQIMGSRAFAAVARGVLYLMTDPDDEGSRLLGLPKNNVGRTDLPTLRFKVEGVKVAETLEGDVWTGKLLWTGETERTIREALESAGSVDQDKSATTEAGDWLVDYLTEQGGAADSAVIRREGGKVGHSKDALARAKHKRGIVSISSGFPRRAFWHLPAVSVCAAAGRVSNTANTANTANTGPGETYISSSSLSLGPVDAVSAVDAVFAGSPGTARAGGRHERL